MYCSTHPKIDTNVQCSRCSKPVCELCVKYLRGSIFCKGCLDSISSSARFTVSDSAVYNARKKSSYDKDKAKITVIWMTKNLLFFGGAFLLYTNRNILLAKAGGLKKNIEKNTVGDTVGRVMSDSTLTEMKEMGRSVYYYRVSNDGYPPDFPAFLRSEMKTDREDPAKDSWGNYYKLTTGPGFYSISSSGPDGAEGTPDDITERFKE